MAKKQTEDDFFKISYDGSEVKIPKANSSAQRGIILVGCRRVGKEGITTALEKYITESGKATCEVIGRNQRTNESHSTGSGIVSSTLEEIINTPALLAYIEQEGIGEGLDGNTPLYVVPPSAIKDNTILHVISPSALNTIVSDGKFPYFLRVLISLDPNRDGFYDDAVNRISARLSRIKRFENIPRPFDLEQQTDLEGQSTHQGIKYAPLVRKELEYMILRNDEFVESSNLCHARYYNPAPTTDEFHFLEAIWGSVNNTLMDMIGRRIASLYDYANYDYANRALFVSSTSKNDHSTSTINTIDDINFSDLHRSYINKCISSLFSRDLPQDLQVGDAFLRDLYTNMEYLNSKTHIKPKFLKRIIKKIRISNIEMDEHGSVVIYIPKPKKRQNIRPEDIRDFGCKNYVPFLTVMKRIEDETKTRPTLLVENGFLIGLRYALSDTPNSAHFDLRYV